MSILKVVSYNIHKGKTATGLSPSMDRLRSGLVDLKPDLVFLQEVQGSNLLNAHLHEQHNQLARHLDIHVAYGRNAIHRHTDHGNALLSRLPILTHENEDVSDHALEQRGLLHVQVELGSRVLHCFVVHLGLFHRSRMRQVGALVKRIQRTMASNAPVIIAGDFNDWNENLEHLFVKELDLTPVFNSPPKTFPVIMPLFSLDRMYHRGFDTVSSQVLQGMPWTRISDHAPLLVELRFKS